MHTPQQTHPPQPQPHLQPSSLGGGHQPTPSKHKKAGMIIGVIIIILFAAIGVFGYVFMSKAPENILETSLENTKDVDTVHMDIQFSIEVDIEKKEAKKKLAGLLPFGDVGGIADISLIEGYILGSIDRTNEDAIKSDLRFVLTGDIEAGKVDMSVRSIDKRVYVLLSELPGIGPMDFSNLLNTWVEADLDPTRDMRPIGLDGDNKVSEWQEKRKKEAELREKEQQDLLVSLLKEYPVHSITNISAPSLFSGSGLYKVEYEINLENLKKVYIGLSGGDVGAELKDGDRFNEAFSSVKKINGVVRVDKKTYVPGFISINIDVETEEGDRVVTTIESTFTKYNEPVTVVVPEETKTFQEVAQEFMIQMMGPTMGAPGSTAGMPIPGDSLQEKNLSNSQVFSNTGSRDFSQTTKNKDGRRLNDVRDIKNALGMVYKSNNVYPVAPSPGVRVGVGNFSCINAGGFGSVGCDSPFLASIGVRPEEGDEYVYISEDGSTYVLSTTLEGEVNGFGGVVLVRPNDFVVSKKDVLNQGGNGMVMYSSDYDGDGLSDNDEKFVHKTNPYNFDTDGDGFDDKTEIDNGYSPLE